MKNAYWILILLIGWSCNSSSGNRTAPTVVKEDSLEYYPPTPAQLTKQEFRQYYRSVSGYFDSTLIRRGFNGSILVAKDGAIIYEKYIGFSNLRTKDPLTDSTSLHIASSGKTFTGMATLRLAQEGKLVLDDSIQTFFPGLPYPGVTVRMLLNHRSGLPNYVYFIPNSKWDKKQMVTNEIVLDQLYTEKPRKIFNAGTRFTYSNTNYVLLAMIIEKVTGRPFPEYMRAKYFEPLGMNHTYVFTLKDTLTAVPSFAANGTNWGNDFLEGTYGDKNIYTTPRDLLKWDQAFYTDQVINKSLLDTAFVPYSNERPSVHNYGLGWRLLMMPNGKKVIYHNGRWHGFNAAFARLTDEKVTIIVLGNRYNSKIYSSARKAYDLFGNYSNEHHGDDEEAEQSAPQKKTVRSSSRKTRNKR
ncbi:MAG: beta-lactamase family protein [Chitinophagaceae bacterium]|nr:beta-lactamase family protein [Chitinophagaceae bacterium]